MGSAHLTAPRLAPSFIHLSQVGSQKPILRQELKCKSFGRGDPGGVRDWMEREGQKVNKANYLWGQLRCNPPGELWGPVEHRLPPPHHEVEGEGIVDGGLLWGVLSWNFQATQPADRAERAQGRDSGSGLWKPLHLQGQGWGRGQQCPLPPPGPLSVLLTLVSGISIQPPSGPGRKPQGHP